jgi:hypothetical protein
VKTIWQVRRAAFGRTPRAIASSAARTPRNKQTTRPPRTHWRSIGTLALLAGAFLLPAFAAQAQVNTQVQVTTQSPNPSNIGQQMTFVVTVTAVSGSTSPTGNVNLFGTTGGLVQLGMGTLSPVSAGVASTTINVTFNQSGIDTIVANYGGAVNTFNGNSTQVTQTVGTPTTTTLGSNPNPSQVNQSVTLTATVTATSGTATPTGTVTFVGPGANTLGANIPLTGSGTTATAQITTTALVTGTVTANYNGVPGTFATSSGSVNQTVNNGAATTTTLMSNPNPSQTTNP